MSEYFESIRKGAKEALAWNRAKILAPAFANTRRLT